MMVLHQQLGISFWYGEYVDVFETNDTLSLLASPWEEDAVRDWDLSTCPTLPGRRRRGTQGSSRSG